MCASPTACFRLRARRRLTTGQFEEHAYGWHTFAYDSPSAAKRRGVTHNGASRCGFSSCMRWYLDDDVTVVVLANAPFEHKEMLAEQMANIVLGMPHRLPRPESTRRVCLAALAGDVGAVDAATQLAHRLATGGLAPPPAATLNRIGYLYLAVHRPRAAVRIQQLQTALYPSDANAWDSLAEAQAEFGDVDAAIASYGRALELDTDRPHSRAMLRRLQRRQR